MEQPATDTGDLAALADEVSLLRRQLERERRARSSAEREGERATAALYETVSQLQDAEEELRQHAEDQRLLHELARELRRELEPALVLRRAAAAVGRATQAERCVIRLADDNGVGPMAAQWTADGVPALAADVDLDTCLDRLCLDAARHQTALAIDDVSHDPRLTSDEQAHVVERLGARSYAGSPMWAGQELVGWVALHHVSEPRPWTSHQLSLADTLGRDVAVALLQAQAYERQAEAVGQLQELDRVKSDFVSTVSHELRTPLTSITGYLELLLDPELDPLTDRQVGMLEVIGRNAERLRLLVEDLLALSSSDYGGGAVPSARIDLHETLSHVRAALTPHLRERALDLVVDVSPTLPGVSGSEEQLERILHHLLSNAIKFTPDGGRVTVAGAADGDTLVLRVEDNGRGIAAADLPHVFDRFFRTGSASHLAIPGTGLGLSVTQAIVEEQGGSIVLDSELDRGTTATVRLPGAVVDGQR